MTTPSKLASEPVRPNWPIEGRSIEDWENHYQRELSDWYRTCHGRYADSFEWECHIGLQFGLQQCIDEESNRG